MWIYISYIIIGVYGFALLMMFLYNISQLTLLFSYISSKYKQESTPVFDLSNPDEIPFVTIQLPVFNEKYVIERLLLCISNLDYPREKMEIQVLDDSNDDSVKLTSELIYKLKKAGVDITHIIRNNRLNFKAGALKEGLKTAKGEFIAIFDADFLPDEDWLNKTIIYFKNAKIGVVQTRWGHLNRDYSLLTKIQAFALDVHFTLEQTGRNADHLFMSFNGTAGIWRKQCILDSGNWSGATLTEDLDLSYRAQLNNWEFKYLENVIVPAELPVIISGARSQQFRWNKGGAENFIKLIGRVFSSEKLPIFTKIHAVMHLGSSSMFFFLLIISVLSIPMLYIKNKYPQLDFAFQVHSFFIVSSIILFINHWVVYKNIHVEMSNRFISFISMFLAFFTLTLGFSVYNTFAVVEAYTGKKSKFERTPKFNITQSSDDWKGKQYLNDRIPKFVILEVLLLLYFVFGLFSSFILNDYTLLPFHFLLVVGFGYVVYNTFRT
ncbi:cellulose synthase family protein [Daejeonella sp.]|uniref:cellulose synthase family protein n=1 Tax=Daejeonella sp. TaxID=2805397 RepID=UPI003C773E03